MAGEDSMFPVVETEIGKLACLTCTDIVFPEMARCLALRGAEVLVHCTSEPVAPEGDAWDVLRRARAYENLCYFLSINAGAFVGSNRPTAGYRGMTQVVDYLGQVQSLTSAPGEAVVTGTVDLNNLRWERTRMSDSGHVWNFLIELRSDLYASVYSKAKRWPNDGWADKKLQGTAETRKLAAEIIAELPNLSHEDRRRILERIQEVEEETEEAEELARLANESFQALDRRDAEPTPIATGNPK